MTLTEFFKENKKRRLPFPAASIRPTCSARPSKAARTCAPITRNPPFSRSLNSMTRRLAETLSADMRVLTLDVLADEAVAANPPTAATHCKGASFRRLRPRRPMTATRCCSTAPTPPTTRATARACARCASFQVRSPLRECGLTKPRSAGSAGGGAVHVGQARLRVPATRVPSGERLTLEKLENTERAEDFLFSSAHGFPRAALNGAARLQFPKTSFRGCSSAGRRSLESSKKHTAPSCWI